jgi:hypothetical protein
MKAYTYLIGWSKLNLWYYGVRYRKGCRVEDLFTKYYTSSTYVHSVMFNHGKPDVIQIRKTFESRKKALVWEQTVQRRMNVLKDPKWLNKNISGAIYYDDEVRAKMREMKMNRTWMHKGKEIILVLNVLVKDYEYIGFVVGRGTNMVGEKNPMYGKKHSNETKKKIGKANSRCTLTESGREVKSVFMKNNNPMNNHDVKLKHHKHSQKQRRKVTDGLVVFDSVSCAAEHHGCSSSTICYKIRTKKEGWNYHPS